MSSTTAPDRIRLTGLSARGFHGVLPFEKEEGQLFLADVTMDLGPRGTVVASVTDDLDDAVDYAAVADAVVEVITGESVNLVETLAERIADVVLAFPRVLQVEVSVHKPQAPLDVAFDDVCVTITRQGVTSEPRPEGAGALGGREALPARGQAGRPAPAGREELVGRADAPASRSASGREDDLVAPFVDPAHSVVAAADSAADILPGGSSSATATGPRSLAGGADAGRSRGLDQEPASSAPAPDSWDDQSPAWALFASSTQEPTTSAAAADGIVPPMFREDHLVATEPASASSAELPWQAGLSPVIPSPATGGAHPGASDVLGRAPSSGRPEQDRAGDPAPTASEEPVDQGPHQHSYTPASSASVSASSAEPVGWSEHPQEAGGTPVPERAGHARDEVALDAVLGEGTPARAVTPDEPLGAGPAGTPGGTLGGEPRPQTAASAPSGPQAPGSRRGGEPWEPEAWEPEPQALPEPVAQDAPRSGAHALDPTPQQDASVPAVLGPEMVPTPQPDAPAHRPWSPSAPSAVDSMAAPTDPAAAVEPLADSGDLPQRPVEPFDSPTDLAEASIDVLGQAPARPVPVVIGLGGNVGTVVIALRTAVATLRNTPGITVTQVAPLARSAAVLEEGSPSQPDFLNTVVLADTTLSPRDLLQVCHQLEDAAGRLRTEPKGPRTLDADIITYGEMTSDDPELTIPHPLAAQRAFVLAPWAEADPFGEINGQSVAALADVAPDRDGLRWLALDWLESDHLPALPTGQYVAPPTDSAEQAPEEPAPGAGHPLPEAAPQDAGAQEAWQEEPAAPAEPWSTSASLPPVAPHSSRSARSARSARSPRSAHSAELAPGAEFAPGAEPVPADGSGAPGAAGVAEAAPQGRAQERRDGIGSLFPDSRSGSWSEPLGWNDVLGRDGRSS